MSNIILPTASEVDAVDESAFIWDDLLDGILTLEQGKAIKCITDQLDADDVLSIREAYAGTGKTANFIRENSTHGDSFKITTVDQFIDTYLYTGDYFENCENASNVYKLDVSVTREIVFDEDGTPTEVKVYDPYSESEPKLIRTIDLAVQPSFLTKQKLSEVDPLIAPKSAIVNADGDTLGTTGDFEPKVVIYMTWPITLGSEEHEKDALDREFAAVLKALPVGGVLFVTHFQLPKTNGCFWNAYEGVKHAGYTFEESWVINTEPDGSGPWTCGIVKRLS
tara:strand:- start:51878 stop:52717 length:840 start_codon:yes stop_codon:yes gene_type:complete